MALNPIFFTALHKSSNGRKLYVHWHTEWLIFPFNDESISLLVHETADAPNTADPPTIRFLIAFLLLFEFAIGKNLFLSLYITTLPLQAQISAPNFGRLLCYP